MIWNEVLDLADTHSFQALGRAILDWEPRLDLDSPPRDVRLFEPDGSLYGICLLPEMALVTSRRERVVRRGDLVVVPSGVAVDAFPELGLLTIRYDGPPPDHFRERFIQIWNIEHIPAPPRSRGLHAISGLIPGRDVRHRVKYSIVDLREGSNAIALPSAEVAFCVGLEGRATLSIGAAGEPLVRELEADQVIAVAPGLPIRVAGTGRIGLLGLDDELAHEAHRREFVLAGNRISREYEPPA
jgi:hypothetical protein